MQKGQVIRQLRTVLSQLCQVTKANGIFAWFFSICGIPMATLGCFGSTVQSWKPGLALRLARKRRFVLGQTLGCTCVRIHAEALPRGVTLIVDKPFQHAASFSRTDARLVQPKR